jgi:hypothetical protein
MKEAVMAKEQCMEKLAGSNAAAETPPSLQAVEMKDVAKQIPPSPQGPKKTKRKMYLCKLVFAGEACPKGARCAFAHALEELNGYKSTLCRNFTEMGFCKHGETCTFAHGPEELRMNDDGSPPGVSVDTLTAPSASEGAARSATLSEPFSWVALHMDRPTEANGWERPLPSPAALPAGRVLKEERTLGETPVDGAKQSKSCSRAWDTQLPSLLSSYPIRNYSKVVAVRRNRNAIPSSWL